MDHHPNYWGKIKAMFQSTNQLAFQWPDTRSDSSNYFNRHSRRWRSTSATTSARPRFWCPRWSPDFGQWFLGFDLDPVVGKRNSKITRDEESNSGDNHNYINYICIYISLRVCVKKDSKLITLVLFWFILLFQGTFVPSNTFGLSGLWVRLNCAGTITLIVCSKGRMNEPLKSSTSTTYLGRYSLL
jgi:hypothetical protein